MDLRSKTWHGPRSGTLLEQRGLGKVPPCSPVKPSGFWPRNASDIHQGVAQSMGRWDLIFETDAGF